MKKLEELDISPAPWTFFSTRERVDGANYYSSFMWPQYFISDKVGTRAFSEGYESLRKVHDFIVCNVSAAPYDKDVGNLYKQRIANGCFIAAAPVTYEALRKLVEYCNLNYFTDKELAPLLDEAEAALAKAAGEGNK